MEDVLRADRIGSASIPRQCLFDSIEKILLNKDANHTASHLMARAREMAIGLAKDRGYVKEQNWQAIADCVLNMLLEAGVLLNAEGKSIPRRIGVYSTQVASVSKDFRQRSEAILVERIIQKLPDVTYHDCYSIGLALYQQGKTNPVSREDLLSRVDALLVYLDTDHRIHAEGIRLVPGPHPSA